MVVLGCWLDVSSVLCWSVLWSVMGFQRDRGGMSVSRVSSLFTGSHSAASHWQPVAAGSGRKRPGITDGNTLQLTAGLNHGPAEASPVRCAIDPQPPPPFGPKGQCFSQRPDSLLVLLLDSQTSQ